MKPVHLQKAPRELTPNPDSLMLGDSRLGFEAPSASAFTLLNGKLLAAKQNAHVTIFAALKALMNQTGKLRDYGVRAHPRLAKADLEVMREIRERIGTDSGVCLGDLRRETRSGRVWKEIRVGGESASVISFWCAEEWVSRADLDRIISGFKLEGSVYVGYQRGNSDQ